VPIIKQCLFWLVSLYFNPVFRILPAFCLLFLDYFEKTAFYFAFVIVKSINLSFFIDTFYYALIFFTSPF